MTMNRCTPKKAENSVRVMALVKGNERYVFLYEDTPTGRAEALRAIGRQASNSELSLTWYDAARLCSDIRHQAGDRT